MKPNLENVRRARLNLPITDNPQCDHLQSEYAVDQNNVVTVQCPDCGFIGWMALKDFQEAISPKQLSDLKKIVVV